MTEHANPSIHLIDLTHLILDTLAGGEGVEAPVAAAVDGHKGPRQRHISQGDPDEHDGNWARENNLIFRCGKR